jgi:hypothetical protein
LPKSSDWNWKPRDIRQAGRACVASEDKRVLNRQLQEIEKQIDFLRARLPQ